MGDDAKEFVRRLNVKPKPCNVMIRLSVDELEGVEIEAKKAKKTLSEFIRNAVYLHVDELQKLAKIKAIKGNKSKTFDSVRTYYKDNTLISKAVCPNYD